MEEEDMNEQHLIQHSKKWDRTGIIVATICLLHCLAFPFLIVLLPALQTVFHNFWFELTIFSLGILVGSISFFTSYKKHGAIQPMLLGFAGVIFLLVSLFTTWFHLSEDHFSFYTIAGGALLITGHIWNIRACACYCDHTCKHDDQHHL